jgi:prepilin peptidase CpaA
LYLLHGMGAGDVKLMAAVGSFLGPLGALLAAATTLTLGALIAIGIVLHRRFARGRSRMEAALSDSMAVAQDDIASVRKQRFPYAVAIAGGTLLFMWHQGQLDPLAAALMG